MNRRGQWHVARRVVRQPAALAALADALESDVVSVELRHASGRVTRVFDVELDGHGRASKLARARAAPAAYLRRVRACLDAGGEVRVRSSTGWIEETFRPVAPGLVAVVQRVHPDALHIFAADRAADGFHVFGPPMPHVGDPRAAATAIQAAFRGARERRAHAARVHRWYAPGGPGALAAARHFGDLARR